MISAVINIIMENIGQTTVDFIAPSFTETASASSNQPKSSKTTREDSYEQDMYAATTHAFYWEAQQTGEQPVVSVPPGTEYVMAIRVFGKRGWYLL